MASRGRALLPSLSKYQVAWLGPDVLAGITLAAVAIPECMGYTKITATPTVTGLYTMLLPVAAFAVLGSSRHLVVGADSATAAILFAGLSGLAEPYSDRWVQLASTAALLTAPVLLLCGAIRMGFLADFLSRTVLVGFLSGVGITLMVRELPDALGVAAGGGGVESTFVASIKALPETNVPTLLMALSVVTVVVVGERFAKTVPSSLLAVTTAIAATWVFGLDQRGVVIVGTVQPGLPTIGLPPVPIEDVVRLFSTSALMCLVILAQSAATSRSFAQKHAEHLDENRDLIALGAANALAGLSGTFVVNGSPTKTAVVDAAGGRTQLAQLVTAAVVLAVLLFATAPIEHLPNAALAAIVFVIGVKLIDVRTLHRIYRLQPDAFVGAIVTMLVVVLFGVEQGILVGIGVSVLAHVRRQYHPKDVVLTPALGFRRTLTAEPGVETEPGLIVYRFGAGLFFPNADYFSARLLGLVTGAPHPVKWVVLDLVSMNDLDYTGGLALAATLDRLREGDISVALTQADAIRNVLDRYGITRRVGADRLFATVHEAVDACRLEARAVPGAAMRTE